MNFAFHRDALAEFEAAALYYAEIDSRLALRFIDAVERAIELVVDAPERYREVNSGIRRCLTRVFPFAILYSIESDYILIVAVMHFSREPDYWRKRTLRGSDE